MIVDAHNDVGPWRKARVFLNGKPVEHCWFADDEQGYCIREWHERVTVTPPEPVERSRAITEWCNGPVRIEVAE